MAWNRSTADEFESATVNQAGRSRSNAWRGRRTTDRLVRVPNADTRDRQHARAARHVWRSPPMMGRMRRLRFVCDLTRMIDRRRCHWRVLAPAVLVVATLVAGCTSDDDGASEPVCQLVDPELASEVVGSSTFSTTGDGAVSRDARTTGPASCSITASDASQPVVQVRVGETADTADVSRRRLDEEAQRGGCELRYSDEPGYGFACTYDSGMYNPGSSVEVLRGDRIVRVVVYKWSGSTHAQRLGIAEKIVVDADANLSAYDDQS